jgi:membrane-associated phospholipid phosphatase
MVTDKITVYGCSGEYGNPSGHSLFSAAFNIFFFLDLFHSNCDQPDFSTLKAKLIYAGALFLAILLTFLIGFARFYVGLHTLNQIVYGWQIGLLLALYFHICLREPVIKHIQTL